MKVKVISRVEEEYTRETKSEAIKIHRNLDPQLRPMHRATEYKRALNATKLDKVFAKPFCGAFEGHSDGILSIAKNVQNLKQMALSLIHISEPTSISGSRMPSSA